MIGLVSVTSAGQTAAERLTSAWPDDTLRYDEAASPALSKAFAECDAIVCFLAVGATVRINSRSSRIFGDSPTMSSRRDDSPARARRLAFSCNRR